MTATTTKSVFYALHYLARIAQHISVKLTRRLRYNSAEILVFRFVLFAKRLDLNV